MLKRHDPMIFAVRVGISIVLLALIIMASFRIYSIVQSNKARLAQTERTIVVQDYTGTVLGEYHGTADKVHTNRRFLKGTTEVVTPEGTYEYSNVTISVTDIPPEEASKQAEGR